MNARAAAAIALAGFWWAATGAAAREAAAQEAHEGQVLVEALGCAACHAGVPGGEAIREVAPPFGDGAAPMAPAYIFHYMADPQTVRPDIAPARMPRYELDERQRVALALFVTNDREMRGVDDALREAMARHADADRAEGAALFETLNCAGCHVHPEAQSRVTAPDLSLTGLRVRPEWLTGYLANPVTIRPAGPAPGEGGQMPDFRLDPAEAASIADYLLELEGPDGADPPAEVADWEPQALSPFAMQKAGTLLRNRWSCLGCHQLGEDGGRIGPGLDGVAQRLRPGYVRAIMQDPAHLAPGTIMPASLAQPDRLDLIASFLLGRNSEWAGSEPVPDLPAPPTATAPGAALYAARCAPCHGVGGAGDGFNAPFLPVTPTVHADSAAMSLRPDDTLYDGIHAGGWILGKSHRMPAFGASLDDGDKRALVAYIRTLCRCEGPAWSRDGRRSR
ncbi:MAG: c-type cytochrome [Gemmatimonadetes bacterium]|nr:c-type cytochrome [Gemmatimonadota bacterium]MYG20805.1 c-type cytochrome [Gemmatimonadota bacterium]MYJ38066.1 c-type cytochrome [Gemmatimonadota bacterium]